MEKRIYYGIENNNLGDRGIRPPWPSSIFPLCHYTINLHDPRPLPLSPIKSRLCPPGLVRPGLALNSCTLAPQVIIHCAAERKPDVCEKDPQLAVGLNIKKTLAALAHEMGARFMYISTEYVFDGRNPPYNVDDVPNPLNKYGESKRVYEHSNFTHKGR